MTRSLFFLTGEIILAMLSMGRRKIRWEISRDEGVDTGVGLPPSTQRSVTVGQTFWVLAVMLSVCATLAQQL